MKGKVPKGFLIGKKSRQEEGEDFAEEFIVSFGVVSVGVVVRVRMGGKGARGGGGGSDRPLFGQLQRNLSDLTSGSQRNLFVLTRGFSEHIFQKPTDCFPNGFTNYSSHGVINLLPLR